MIINKSSESEKEKDLRILKQVLKGNKQAFGELVLKYQNRVLSLGISFLKNEDDALDFCQDVMLKAYQALSTFKMKSSFYTWLMSIAYNMAINSKRKKARFTLSIEDYDFASPQLTPEERFIRQALRRSIEEAVNDLPEKYKVCIELYFFYDVSYQEIELITALPQGTIKSYVFRAKKLLKAELEKDDVKDVVIASRNLLPFLCAVEEL